MTSLLFTTLFLIQITGIQLALMLPKITLLSVNSPQYIALCANLDLPDHLLRTHSTLGLLILLYLDQVDGEHQSRSSLLISLCPR